MHGGFPILPIVVFCIVFGLSMDYEVFIVSRIADGRRAGLGDGAALVEGLASTGRVITFAASIMVMIFGAFVLRRFRAHQDPGLRAGRRRIPGCDRDSYGGGTRADPARGALELVAGAVMPPRPTGSTARNRAKSMDQGISKNAANHSGRIWRSL